MSKRLARALSRGMVEVVLSGGGGLLRRRMGRKVGATFRCSSVSGLRLVEGEGTYLWGKVKSAAMAHDDLFGWCRDSHVRDIRPCLATSQHQDSLVHTKLCPGLELGRVHLYGHVLHAGDLRDVGGHMEAGTHGNGITFPLCPLACLFDQVCHRVLARHVSGDGLHLGRELDVFP